jgi:flagellar L-ring protein FlgH
MTVQKKIRKCKRMILALLWMRMAESGFNVRRRRHPGMAGPHHPYHAFKRFMIIALLIVPLAVQAGEGSLWNETSPINYQFQDYRGRHIGDIISIVIMENSSASDSSESGTERKSEITGTIGEVLNNGAKILDSVLPFEIFKFSSNNKFEGEGETKRQNSFSARVAVKIKKIQPNGNFIIEGRRTIIIGKDKKDIILTGEVSPYSIDESNSVPSTAVADAQITYQGVGPVSNSGKPTLFHRILDIIPFF